MIAGQYDFAVAGGVESMTRVPMGTAGQGGQPTPDTVLQRYGVDGFSQGTGAEMVAEKWGLLRTRLDEFSLRSHELAAAAIDAGALDSQLAPIGGLQADEGVRRGGTLEKLAALKPAFADDGVIHAGNSSQISDGAGALLITSSELARARGLTPIARVHTAVLAGDDPVIMLTAGGRHHPVPGGMLETAENLRREYGISREEQDQLALTSHQRAVAAQRSGVFAEEIVPVPVRTKQGEVAVDTDEHPRADATLDSLAKLRPVFGKQDPDATVTAGNASGQNDAAAVCVVTHPDRAAELGLRPLVRLVSLGVAGVAPKIMGIGPVPATAAALTKADLKLSDVDLIELNEAFAAQVLACTREWGLGEADFERLNVHGSGISLGHPVGATGTRILCTMAREMHRRDARYALETMCIGGGQGLAAIFERVTA